MSYTLCLDAGHQNSPYIDTGCQGFGLREEDITLDICKRIKSLLEFNEIKVVMTREGDYVAGIKSRTSNSLQERCIISDNSKADIFVSVHCNAFNSNVSGSEVHICGKGGNAEKLANYIIPQLAKTFNNRGLKVSGGLYVLKNTNAPAVLLECGFLDNKSDNAKLANPDIRQQISENASQGICNYFGIKFSKPSVSIPSNPTPIPTIMYRVIIDGKQIMALSNLDDSIAKVKELIDSSPTAKLGIVQRNTDSRNLFSYSKSTPKTLILGTETVSIEQCKQFIKKVNPNAPDIIPIYKKYGEILGIKWGYAVAHMIKETSYLRYGGDVSPSQNNYAGIGAVGNGAKGACFNSSDEGVLAHLEHLFAYASKQTLPSNLSKVDPRYDLVTKGIAPNWEDLNGRWAVPGNNYGQEIIQIYELIKKEVVIKKQGKIIFSLYEPDARASAYLSDFTGIKAIDINEMTQDIFDSYEEIIQIGGEKVNSNVTLLLSGTDRYDTLISVLKYMGKIK